MRASPLLGAAGALCLSLAVASQVPSVAPRERASYVPPLAPRATPSEPQEPIDPPPASAFVRVEGLEFELEGAPFRFVGANAAIMHGRRHRDSVDAVLDAVVQDGLRVVRIWALGERAEDAPAWARDYAFRVGRQGWVSESFEHLDRVLEAARARDLRVIVVLANRWRDFGGAQQYLRWTGAAFDQEAPEGVSPLELPAFWSSARADWLYQEHVRRVVGRVSSRTGVAYRDDPTVMAWELVNESSVPARGRATLVAWTGQMARFVRSLDPHHLISAGHIGYDRAADRDTWRAVQAVAEIDYCDAHAYPAHRERVTELRGLPAWIDDRVRTAHHDVRKPMVFGELGFTTRTPALMGAPRTTWLEAFLRHAQSRAVSGVLMWTYAPRDEPAREHSIHPDDEAVADVRAALAAHARRLRESDDATPVEWPSEAAPLGREVRGRAAPHSAWQTTPEGRVLEIVPEAFAVARFEGGGLWDRGSIVHLYGVGRGYVEYRFTLPRGAQQDRLRVRMRASSELPGNGGGRTEDDISRVTLSVDGEAIGTLDLPPDDGLGRWVEVSGAPTWSAAATHTLRIEVSPDVGAEGLVLYGAATGRYPLPDDVGELPGRIEIISSSEPARASEPAEVDTGPAH